MSDTLENILASEEAMKTFLDKVASHRTQGDGGVRTNYGFCSPAELDRYVEQRPVVSPEQEKMAAGIIVDAVSSYD